MPLAVKGVPQMTTHLSNDHEAPEQEVRHVFADYPTLYKYATVMSPPSRPVLGRDDEMHRLIAALARPELSNPFLLGAAGAGKTMLVQGVSEMDTRRLYVEVDLAKMASSEDGEDGTVQMATRIKTLFEEAIQFREALARAQDDDTSYSEAPQYEEIVAFVDEFHLLIQLSAAAAQAIKPILAESGRRGVRIIAATTFDEFHEFIEKDQALMQRLQRINVREPEKEVVLSILRSVASSHDVLDIIYDETLFEKIYEYSNRYVPADSQPRKSILMLDAMIGWRRAFPQDYDMNSMLLAKVIYESSGVHVAFELDAGAIEQSLNRRVFSQPFASRVIENRLQIAVADLYDKTRPIASMLFTGSTGTGKTEMVKGMAALLFGDERRMVRFDMSEYALEASLERFRSELTHAVWNNSHTIVLLDEVEKAAEPITRILLQVLDDGRLSNAQGREVSFLNTYIVMTTNAGANVYQEIQPYLASDTRDLTGYEKVIRSSILSNDKFPTELLNRMNAVVPFKPLDGSAYARIVDRHFARLMQKVKETNNVELSFHRDVHDFILKEKLDENTDGGGARGIVTMIETDITSAVARALNEHPEWKHLLVSVTGDMASRDKTRRLGTATVQVTEKDAPPPQRQTLKSAELNAQHNGPRPNGRPNARPAGRPPGRPTAPSVTPPRMRTAKDVQVRR